MPALAQAKPRVVVIGGGPGGATVAKYVAKDGGAIDVTLVEPLKQFTTCFHSNLYLGGFRSFESITHTYDKLASKLRHQAQPPDGGRDRPRQEAGAARRRHRALLRPARASRPASTSSSTPCPAIRRPRSEERCRTPGRPARRPSCCKRSSTRCRTARIIVMIAPPNPYRCPPGPYERVSMMAHVLKAKGHKKSQIVVSIRRRPSPSRACSWRAGRSTIPAWSSGRTRRCTTASSASIPRP